MSENEAIKIAISVASQEGLEPAQVGHTCRIALDDPLYPTEHELWLVYFQFPSADQLDGERMAGHPPVVEVDCVTREAKFHLGM